MVWENTSILGGILYMDNKKVITGKTVAKVVSMMGIVIMLIALVMYFFFDFAKDSRVVFIIVLCACVINFIVVSGKKE